MEAILRSELVLHLQAAIRHCDNSKAQSPPDDAYRMSQGIVGFSKEKAQKIADRINTEFLARKKEHGWFYIVQDHECFNVFVRLW